MKCNGCHSTDAVFTSAWNSSVWSQMKDISLWILSARQFVAKNFGYSEQQVVVISVRWNMLNMASESGQEWSLKNLNWCHEENYGVVKKFIVSYLMQMVCQCTARLVWCTTWVKWLTVLCPCWWVKQYYKMSACSCITLLSSLIKILGAMRMHILCKVSEKHFNRHVWTVLFQAW